MKWKIRDIEIANQLVLAPMAGITNEAFRLICKENGAGLLVAEMVSDKALGFKNEKTIKMTKVNELEHPISMQVFGSDVESMVKAAKWIDENSEADIIDINMGCPVNKVAKKSGAGASLLVDPQKVYLITKSIVEAVKKPVTVKIRIGWDNDSINAVENAMLIEKAGATAITVHGRTRNQFYSGKANYDIIKAVKEAVKIPVIANGDIIDATTAKAVLDYTKADAIMIGRGALGNPWVFKEILAYLEEERIIEKPSNEEIMAMIIKLYNYLLDLKGEHLATLEMRSHVSWFLKGKPGSARVKDLICKQTSFDKVLEILKDYFKSI